MSATPPHRTHTLVKDFIFQEKYKLTSTQTDLMAYIVNIFSWSINVGGYYVLLTSKIKDDLRLNIKTIEASLLQLKKLNLIETKLVKVEIWESNKKFRAIKVTKRGREYNQSFYNPKEKKIIVDLEAEIQELKKKNQALKKQVEDTPKKLGFEETSKNRGNNYTTHKVNKEIIKGEEMDFVELKKMVTKKFGDSLEPICNGVDNQDRWFKKTTFYINSYRQLAIITPNGEHKQLQNPSQILNFWQWLFKNQHQIGKIKDFNAVPNISKILKFIGEKITLNRQVFTIDNLVAVQGGVNITLKDERGKVGVLCNKRGERVHLIEEVEGLFKTIV